jgi:nucleoside-diphosphate-sugar epimerase
MNIFLTGATGFVGKKFLSLALEKNHFIYAVTRKKQSIKHKNLKWLIGSIQRNWSNELKKSNVLVHLASDGVINKEISYLKAKKFNIDNSISLFKIACKNNCKKWIVAGSMSEYGASCRKKKKLSITTKPKPETNYEKTKYIFTKKILTLSKKEKSQCRIMRIFHAYGEGEYEQRLYPMLANAAKNNEDFFIRNAHEIRDFINVNNVAKVLLDSCNFEKKKITSTQIWHVASGKPMTIKTFAKKIWNKFKSSGNLNFNKLKNINQKNYVSDIKSIWKI